MAIVYQHRRLANSEIFYIGIGVKEGRAYLKTSRNKHWHNIANSVNYIVEITHKDVSWEEACSIEKYLICFYGRKDLGLGLLVNMTDGGEGTYGMSKEHKKEMSIRMSGANSPNYGKTTPKEVRDKISKSNKGRIASDEFRQRRRELTIGANNPNYRKTTPKEVRDKIAIAHKGIKLSDDHKKSLSLAKRGVKLSENHKNNLRISHLGVKHKILICPFCSKSGGDRNMKRYHFDNRNKK